MRFSDLKRKKDAAGTREDVLRTVAASLPPPKAAPPAPLAKTGVPAAAAIPSAALDAKKSAAQRVAARAVYGRGVALLRGVFSTTGPQPEGVFAELARLNEDLIELIAAGNHPLCVLTACGTPDEPACAHTLNVTICALKLGVRLHLPAAKLSRLGMAALLHDLGQTRTFRLAFPKTLSASETQRLRLSLKDAPERLAAFGDAPAEEIQAAGRTISQLHVGTGAELAAQIISLSDVYEAVTHGYDGVAPTPARDAFKTLVGLKNLFDHALVKRLLEEVSPFPPGSLVKLADGRVGCVVAVNPKTLTRPVVEIWLQADGRAQEPPITLDLSRELMLGIAGFPDEAKLAESPAAASLRELRVWSDAA